MSSRRYGNRRDDRQPAVVDAPSGLTPIMSNNRLDDRQPAVVDAPSGLTPIMSSNQLDDNRQPAGANCPAFYSPVVKKRRIGMDLLGSGGTSAGAPCHTVSRAPGTSQLEYAALQLQQRRIAQRKTPAAGGSCSGTGWAKAAIVGKPAPVVGAAIVVKPAPGAAGEGAVAAYQQALAGPGFAHMPAAAPPPPRPQQSAFDL
jgi:hypothetical protein